MLLLMSMLSVCGVFALTSFVLWKNLQAFDNYSDATNPRVIAAVHAHPENFVEAVKSWRTGPASSSRVLADLGESGFRFFLTLFLFAGAGSILPQDAWLLRRVVAPLVIGCVIALAVSRLGDFLIARSELAFSRPISLRASDLVREMGRVLFQFRLLFLGESAFLVFVGAMLELTIGGIARTLRASFRKPSVIDLSPFD